MTLHDWADLTIALVVFVGGVRWIFKLGGLL